MSEIEKKEEWYLNIDYREAKEIIRNKLQGMTQNFIGIGFYLRQIKESEGFRKDGYESIYEMAEDQYGIKRSTAIRWMQMNEKFSQGGYSPFLDSGYKDFGKSQLQEMLYLDSEQLEEVKPEMTVREIREIRTPDPEPEEQIPGQMSVEDFPEVLPEQEEESGEEVCDVAQSENTDCKPEQSSCPPGQTSCPRENWGTSDEDQLQGWRECAACWNHYKKLHEHDEEIPKEENVGIEIPQDIMEEVTEPVEDYQEIPEENEPVIVEQPEGIAIVDAPSEPELYEEVSEKTDIDIAREENQKAQMYLEIAEKEFSQNDIRVRKQKILVAALAGYIHDLDMVLNPPEEPEQPELPKLRNNDQRKEWLNNYKDWGLWYRDENIDVNYYKYDFEDGSRLVVAEYPQREQAWKCLPRDEHYYHLLEKGRRKAGTTDEIYDHQYIQYADSETYLVEFLKNLQKGEK